MELEDTWIWFGTTGLRTFKMKKILFLLLSLYSICYATFPEVDYDGYHYILDPFAKSSNGMLNGAYVNYTNSFSQLRDSSTFVPVYTLTAGNANNSLLLNGYPSSHFMTVGSSAGITALSQATDSMTFVIPNASTATFAYNANNLNGLTSSYIIAVSTSLISPPNLSPYLLITNAATTYFTISSGTVNQVNIYNLQQATGSIISLLLNSTNTFTGRNTFTQYTTIYSTMSVQYQLGIGCAPLYALDVQSPNTSLFRTAQSGIYDSLNYIMSSYTLPAPNVVSASGEVNGARLAWMAWDNNTGTGWISNNSWPVWLKYDFGSGNTYIVIRYTMYGVNTTSPETNLAPKSWVLQASNDNSFWVSLDTQTNASAWSSGEIRTYDFVNTTPYRYYRIWGTASQGGTYFCIADMTLQTNLANALNVTPALTTFGMRTSTGTLASGNGVITIVGEALRGRITGLRQIYFETINDDYGSAWMKIVNRAYMLGVAFGCNSTFGLDTFDMMFFCQDQITYRTIRLENRIGLALTGSRPEFQIGNQTGGVHPTLCISDTAGLFLQPLSVMTTGSATFNVSGTVHMSSDAVTGHGMYLINGGNIGIGTSSPFSTLNVNGITSLGSATNYFQSSSTGVIFVGSSACLPHSSLYAEDISSTVVIASTYTYSGLTGGLSDGNSVGFTISGSSCAICGVKGVYIVSWSVSAMLASGANQHIEGKILVNQTAQVNGLSVTHIQNTTDEQSFSGSGIVSLNVGDTIGLCFQNQTAVNNIIVTHVSMSVFQIGG